MNAPALLNAPTLTMAQNTKELVSTPLFLFYTITK